MGCPCGRVSLPSNRPSTRPSRPGAESNSAMHNQCGATCRLQQGFQYRFHEAALAVGEVHLRHQQSDTLCGGVLRGVIE